VGRVRPRPAGLAELPGELDAVVVGAGVVGLTAARALQMTGRRVAIVTADAVERTTSNVAAAVWFPTEVGPRDRALAWGRRTFEVLTETVRVAPEAGVLLRDTLMLYRAEPGRPWWSDAIDDVRDARPADLPAGYRHGLRFAVPLAEMPRHLRWLADRFRAAGGTIHLHRLDALDELAGSTPVVVNCSGLGARELVGDASLHPIRGQVVRVTNPGLTVSLRDQHHPEGYTYVHPRSSDVILGGTVQVGRSDLEPGADTTAAIVARCTALAPALADAEVIAPAVGLRPGRPEVRLERDDRSVPGTTVVHDYGHGGAGLTLGWGCAEEVVRLIEGPATA
jgi:D-amino-acid oxidase